MSWIKFAVQHPSTKFKTIKRLLFLHVVIFLFLYILSALLYHVDGRGLNEISFYKSPFSKGLPVFMVVRFRNQPCRGSEGEKGTCLSSTECRFGGGTKVGGCAGKFGTCCVFERTCDSTSRVNNTQFVNPGYPLSMQDTGACAHTIAKVNDDICQLRLDFDEFTLSPPTQGECDTDTFVVTCDGRSAVPALCGNNTGQHVYLDFPRNVKSCSLHVATLGKGLKRKFSIRIAQIPCSSGDLAPSGCLQYFRSVSGTLASFNTGGLSTTSGMTYPPSQNYAVCVRREGGFCSLRYSTSAINGRFQIDSIDPNVPCTDYVLIPRGNGGTASAASAAISDRHCGTKFAAVTTSATPFVLYVASDDNPEGGQGFLLDFMQLPCTM